MYHQHANEVNGINLANYLPEQRSYNSVIYVHKRLFNKHHHSKRTEFRENTDNTNENKRIDKVVSLQLRTNNTERDKKLDREKLDNDSILDHTINFAKNIVPIAMPSDGVKHTVPVFYTVKACQKSKKKSHKHQEYNLDQNYINNTYDKDKISKPSSDKLRKETVKIKREKYSNKLLVSNDSSQSNTIDEININNLSPSSVSENSAKKYQRHKQNQKPRNVLASESLEALANEMINTSSKTTNKIKIHLMGEKDKNIFCKNLQIPIVKAIKDCLLELDNHDATTTKICNVQKIVKDNSQKLENIVQKLACIENKLNILSNGFVNTPGYQASIKQSSALEDLGEDIVEAKGISSSEADWSSERIKANQKFDSDKNINVNIKPGFKNETDLVRIEDLGSARENKSDFFKESSSVIQLGVAESDCPIRIPTRFCWNETSRTIRKNLHV